MCHQRLSQQQLKAISRRRAVPMQQGAHRPGAGPQMPLLFVGVPLRLIAGWATCLLFFGAASVGAQTLPITVDSTALTAPLFEIQGVANAHGFAVDLKGLLTLAVFNPEVVADRNQLLSHLVAAVTATTARTPILASILSSSTSHFIFLH